MVALHAVWRADDRLALWAEDQQTYAVAPDALAALLAGVGPGLGWLGAQAVPGVSSLLLPARAGRPSPSPELLGPAWAQTVLGGTLTLEWFPVSCLLLGPEHAAQLLGELWECPPALGSLGPDGAGEAWIGASLRWLGRVHDLAWRTVHAGQVLPALVGRRAIWQAAPDAVDPRALRALVAAAPPVVRAEDRAAAAVADELLAAMVDAETRLALRDGPPLVRPGRGPAASTPPAAEAWVRALSSVSGEVEAAPGELERLSRRLRAWHRSLRRPVPTLRLCLRLVEPLAQDDEDDVWRLDLLVQTDSEPSILATPPDVAPEALADFERELSRAAALWPVLRFALREERPEWVSLDRAGALAFLQTEAAELAEAGFGVLLPAWWGPPSPVGVALSARAAQPGTVATASRIGREAVVDFDWRAAVGGELLAEEELRTLARSAQRLVRVRGQWLEVDPAGIAAALAFLTRAGSGQAPLAEVLTLQPDPAHGLEFHGIRADGELADIVAGAHGVRVADVAVPAWFSVALRPYQQRGLDWLALMARLGLGAVLADDMGLGKTVQLLALLAVEHEQGETGPTLVVCPMSIVGNWAREAARFAPRLRVHVHHGASRLDAESLAAAVDDVEVVVTTYGLVQRDAAVLAVLRWRRVVLDEAQNVKNSATLQARAVRMLPARHRVALTGTPVENRLADLHAVLDATNPGLFGTAHAFKERYSAPIERDGNVATLAALHRATAPFILRRTKNDPAIARELPAKQEMTVLCNLTSEQAAVYRGVVEDMLDKMRTRRDRSRRGVVLSALTRLKQVCNHPALALGDGSPLPGRSGKLTRLEDLLEEVLAEGDRALCFTQYATWGHLLVPHLAQRLDTEVGFLHGGLSAPDRDAMVQRFQAGEGPPVLLLSLRAGGTGLTLTAANQVIHVDRWWNPAVEDQATDRAFRIGQDRDVQVRRLVCIGTVEERIDDMLAAKRELASAVTGGADGWLADLSTDAVAELVALSADAVSEQDA